MFTQTNQQPKPLTRHCPALLISAPGSNHGKTTITAALANYHREQGRKVRVFKAGPDFLDPMILEQASGHPVYQLDLWLGGEQECRRLLYEAAADADLLLIEGVMGLFDGQPCCADIAQLFNVPVLAVIDTTGVAQTLGAIAHGLAHYRPGLPFAGVLANSVASPRHAEMIASGMMAAEMQKPEKAEMQGAEMQTRGLPPGIHYFGAMPRAQGFTLPERHLGLVQASEVDDLQQRIQAASVAIGLTGLAKLPPAVAFDPPQSLSSKLASNPVRLLEGVHIGIARDAAFSFIYPANLDLLQGMGAELVFFSPLADQQLPSVDSIYLPGGYPELHLAILAKNTALKHALHAHVAEGKPLYAECGGMLYLLESLTDKQGNRGEMAAILPGHAVMQARLTGLGYQTALMPGGSLRGHTFHHSLVETLLQPFSIGERLFNTSAGEQVFQQQRLVASYLHCYFASNPLAAAALFSPSSAIAGDALV